MAIVCITKDRADKLKQAFRSGDLSIEKLFELGSSEKRISELKKYIGDGAEFINLKLEKAFISPAQNNALRNVVFEMFGKGKPLYKDITIDEARSMANLNMVELKKMSSEARIKKLSEFVDDAKAVSLNDRFERLKKTGNLANWEERVIGTKELRENAKIKGELAKLEVLDDLGVLSPKQTEQFMEAFVESKLGVSLTVEESRNISRLTKVQSEAFDKVGSDWTYSNKNNILDYFKTRKELEKYMDTLGKDSTIETVSDIARANILASPRILVNSLLYQTLPGAERILTKRLVSGNFSDGILKSNIIEKLQAKLSGSVPTKGMRDFIKKQTAMALEIYHKTGYDISRMDTLDAGKKIFGERFGSMQGKKFAEAKGIKEKSGALLRSYGRISNLAPKWMAGGTDTLFANLGRADTVTMLSKEIARLEAMKGKLPEGMTELQRSEQLLKESYSFNPKDPQALKIREQGILDAHKMNGTQYSWMAEQLTKLRNNLNLGKFKLGKVIVPFLKIPATVKAEGLKTVSGKGIYNAVRDISRASKLKGSDRSNAMQKGVNDLVRYMGFSGAAVFVTTLLDNDDYVGAWDTMNYNDYQLAKAENASTDMIRIGGTWVPLRFLPIIDIPIAAIMQGRQAKERGGDALAGALGGILGQLLSIPGIKEIRDMLTKVGKVSKADDKEQSLEELGISSDLADWARVRAVPSILSYDLYNQIVEQSAKYDYLGREVEGKSTWLIPLRTDTSNDVTAEFNRLSNVGELPTISDPKTEYTAKMAEKLGAEEYVKKLNELKRNLAKENEKTINSNEYKKSSDEDKKKMLNNNRTDYLLDELKEPKKFGAPSKGKSKLLNKTPLIPRR